MAATETVILALGLLKELVAIIVEAVKGMPTKTPQELREQLKEAIDQHDDEWLKNAVEDADTVFAVFGGEKDDD